MVGKCVIRVTREAIVSLFETGVHVIKDGLPKDSKLVMFQYLENNDSFIFTFESSHLLAVLENCSVPTKYPAIMVIDCPKE